MPDFSKSEINIRAVAVVSGLPRSGTSLLMQMLAAGGLPVRTDQRRTADESNPRGYLELDAVRGLKTNPAALDGADGYAVKVVAMLLPHLPPNRPYRVLLLQRDLHEVVASQRAMIKRLGKAPVPLDDERLKTILAGQRDEAIRWCDKTEGVELLELQHRTLTLNPVPAIEAICDFLSVELDRAAMAAVPDAQLYRQRG